MRATWPAHILVDFITLIIFGKRADYETPHRSVFSSIPQLPPSFLSNLFSNTLSVCSLGVRVHVSQPYNAYSSVFGDEKGRQNVLNRVVANISRI
jgi:hypothetical protein